MSKREREDKDEKGGEEKRMALKFLQYSKKAEEYSKKAEKALKQMKASLQSEYEKKYGSIREGETYLMIAALLGDVYATKALIRIRIPCIFFKFFKFCANLTFCSPWKTLSSQNWKPNRFFLDLSLTLADAP